MRDRRGTAPRERAEEAAVHVLLSLCLGLGLALAFHSLTGGNDREAVPDADPAEQPAGPPPKGGWIARRLPRSGPDGAGLREFSVASGVAAAGTALVAQFVFGWPVVTLALAGVGGVMPSWYFRQRAQRRRSEVEEAVGEAVETLRDAVRIGLGIEEAIRALGRTGPVALRPICLAMERDFRLVGFEAGLGRARERLQEPLFDTLAVALLTAYRIGGRNLAAVLDGLSQSVRGSVQIRREVRANQAQNVLSARVIAALPATLILVIRATNPNYLTAFSQPTGQVVLGCCLLSIAVGYTVMLRATALPGEGRVLR